MPLIIFSFSRREAAEMARKLAPSVRFRAEMRRRGGLLRYANVSETSSTSMLL